RRMTNWWKPAAGCARTGADPSLDVRGGDWFALVDGDGEAFQIDVAGVVEAEAAVGGDVAALKSDALDGASGEAVNGADGHHVSGDVADLHVADDGQRVGVGLARAHHAPFHVHLEGLAGLVQDDVLVGDVFDDASAAG